MSVARALARSPAGWSARQAARLSARPAAGWSARRSGQPTADCSARQSGQGLVEYGLILGLAAVVTVVALVFFGGALASALSLIGQAIDAS